MPKLSINLQKLHPHQHDFLNRTERHQLFSGGAGIGKSVAGQIKLLLHALQNPRSQCLFCSSTWSSTISIFLPILMRRLDKFPIGFYEHEKGNHKLKFPNGSAIHYRNLEDPTALRSLDLDFILLEEATLIEDFEDVWNECKGRLRNNRGPQQLIAITNPGLKTHYLYNHFFERKQGWSVSYPAYLGKHLPAEYLKDLESLPPKKRESLLLGEWGVLEGQAFDPTIEEPPDCEKYYITFDYGFSPSPTVYLLIGVSQGRHYVVNEITLYSTPINQHKRYLDSWYERYPIRGFTGETATGAAEVREFIRETYGTRHLVTSKRRTRGWSRLADWLDLKKLIIAPGCVETIKSLTSLVWIDAPTHLGGADVEGEYDHHADATRYWVMVTR